jgi:hypothetical protein
MEKSLQKLQRTHILTRREMLYRTVYKTSKKNFLLEFCFACILHFRIFTIGIRNLALKHWFVHQIVEWILPYKMRYFSLFGFLIKHLNFCFLITFIFEKSIFRSKFISRRSSFSENTYSFTDIKARLEFNNPFCRTMSTQQNYHI